MNKKLIAAAVVAGLAAPMAAQADVNVYGIASIAIDNLSTHDLLTGTAESKHTTVDDPRGNTRLGVRWSEDLGGGLKALGEFELSPVDLTEAAKPKGQQVYTRQTWAGIKGGFGQVEIGTVLQPYKYAGGVKYDAFVGTIAEARGGNGGMLPSAFGQGGYFANALAYRNHFGNMSFALAYSPSDQNDTGDLYAGSKGDLMANFIFGFNGGEVGVAYAKNDTAGDVTAAATADGQTNTKIFGKYSFGGAFTVLAQYENSKSKFSNQEFNIEGVNAGNLHAAAVNPDGSYPDIKVMFVGLQYKMGMNSLALQYAQTDIDGASEKLKYTALGGAHHFSKKTSVYLVYRTTKMTSVVDNKAFGVGLVEKF